MLGTPSITLFDFSAFFLLRFSFRCGFFSLFFFFLCSFIRLHNLSLPLLSQSGMISHMLSTISVGTASLRRFVVVHPLLDCPAQFPGHSFRVTRACILGGSQKRGQNEKWLHHLAFSSAQKWAELQHNPCVLGSP